MSYNRLVLQWPSSSPCLGIGDMLSALGPFLHWVRTGFQWFGIKQKFQIRRIFEKNINKIYVCNIHACPQPQFWFFVLQIFCSTCIDKVWDQPGTFGWLVKKRTHLYEKPLFSNCSNANFHFWSMLIVLGMTITVYPLDVSGVPCLTKCKQLKLNYMYSKVQKSLRQKLNVVWFQKLRLVIE